MTNPARELAFLLQNWRKVNNNDSIQNMRGLQSGSAEEWRLQLRAAELLAEVDRALGALAEAGQDVDHYRTYFVEWARAVFLPEFNWAAGMSGITSLYEGHVVLLLKATADLLDRTSEQVAVDAEHKADSIDALDQILEALKEAPLHDTVRRYVFELIVSCRTVLQEADTLNSVDLFARIHELVGVLTILTQSMMSEPDTASWAQHIRDLASRLAPYVWVPKAVGFVLEAGSNLKQITGGS